jgi:repressor LexA
MMMTTVEAIGPKIRTQRRKLGLTLDELAGRTAISKPYLSLIETGRVANPPSDEKLRRIEQALGFGSAELISQAHLHRTPQDVRAMLLTLATPNGSKRRRPPTPFPQLTQVSGSPSTIGGAITVLSEYISCPDLLDKDAFAARLFDDQMRPEYRSGDVVIFSPALTARSGDDCFVRLTDGRTSFHRVFFEKDADQKSVIRLQPRNAAHRAVIVLADQIDAIYRAAYKYQRVGD